MPTALFVSISNTSAIPNSDECLIEFNFVVCGDSTTDGQTINAPFNLSPLDTPLQIKRKISIAMRDAAGFQGVTLLANDILVPDLSRGLLV